MPRRKVIPAAVLMVGVLWVIVAGVLVLQISRLDIHAMRGVSALMDRLPGLFGILALSVMVLLMGLALAWLCCRRDTLRLVGGRCIGVASVGPFRRIVECDLARLHNLRIEADRDGKGVRVRYDYDDVSGGIGDVMSPSDAERLVADVQSAMIAQLIDAAPEA